MGITRITHCDDNRRLHGCRPTDDLGHHPWLDPADPTGTQAEFRGRQHQMFARDAHVHPRIVHTRNQGPKPVCHEGAFHADDHMDRRVERPRHLDAGQKTLFNDAPPQRGIAHHGKPPRLQVAGRRREPGRLHKLLHQRLGHGLGLIGAATHSSRNSVPHRHSHWLGGQLRHSSAWNLPVSRPP